MMRTASQRMVIVLLAALLVVMLGGCGQKGPLMLPGDQDARTGAPAGGAQPGGESPDEDEEESATGAQREPR